MSNVAKEVFFTSNDIHKPRIHIQPVAKKIVSHSLIPATYADDLSGVDGTHRRPNEDDLSGVNGTGRPNEDDLSAVDDTQRKVNHL